MMVGCCQSGGLGPAKLKKAITGAGRGLARTVAGHLGVEFTRLLSPGRIRIPAQKVAQKRSQTIDMTGTRKLVRGALPSWETPSPLGNEGNKRVSSRFEQPLHFVNQVSKMKRLGEDAGVLWRRVGGVQRHRGEARDEHNLDFRVELSGATSKLDAVHLRHDDIGQQQLERFLAQPIVRGQPVVERSYVVAGVLQRLDEKASHVVIVLRK